MDLVADRLTGGALTLKQAADEVRSLTGLKPHYATLIRWMSAGRLAHYRVGGRVMTTRAALRAMLDTDAHRKPRTKQRDAVEAAGAAAAARIAAGQEAA